MKINQEIIEQYLNYCEHFKGLSKLSVKAYTIDLKQFSQIIDDILSRTELNEYIMYVYNQYKPKTAKRKIASIKAFYRYMELEDIIEVNPFHKIAIKHKEPLLLPKVIPFTYVQQLFKYAYNHIYDAKTTKQTIEYIRNVIAIELLFATGMRVSELSTLKRDNLDITTGNIRIYGKGSKERVSCVTNRNLLELIKLYYSLVPYSDFVLQNRSHNQYSEQSIRNMIALYCKQSSIPSKITPHMFRHTFATMLLDENVDIRHIQKLLGHSSITTTQIYTYASTAILRDILTDKHPRNKIIISIDLDSILK